MTPQDVLNALEDIEFGDFKPRLEAELASKPKYDPHFLMALAEESRRVQ